jgi:heme oxygenase
LPSLQAHLEGVRATINSVASQWSREEKDACIQETPHTFCWGGRLVQLITEGKAMGH